MLDGRSTTAVYVASGTLVAFAVSAAVVLDALPKRV
jgi:hypothetical protein